MPARPGRFAPLGALAYDDALDPIGGPMHRLHLLALAILLLAASPAPARTVSEVNVPDTLALAGETRPLALNGAGVRTKYLFKIYVGALYTAEPMTRSDQVLAATSPRVMRLQFVRALKAGQLATGWKDGFAANQDRDALARLAPRLDQFNRLMRDVKVGDVMQIEFRPNGDTRLLLDDQPLGTLAGRDFQQALLQVWFGRSPADRELMAALLGGR
jgi:hypothetical protein